MGKILNKLQIGIFLLLFLFLCIRVSYSQTPTPTSTPPDNSQAISDLQNKISDLQNKINDLKNQQETLSSQISVMDSQIKLTEYRIESTKEQITGITLDIDTAAKKIASLQNALNNSVAVLLNRIVATYEVGSIQPLQILLTSGSASDFIQRLNYLKRAQAHDKKLIYDTQQAKTDYANQKMLLENKKKQVEVLQQQLQAYSDQLSQQKEAKKQLLAETQGSEANYQALLAQAKAQLSGFASFVDSQGASLLSSQTSCDGWGCYYNQRDSQWGSLAINGQTSGCGGPCSIARVGCLITSVAMIASNKGHRDISPSDIAISDPGNFSVGTAMLKKGTISVKGVNITRTTIASKLSPDLVQSGPVIVGIYYGQFGTHFVVIKSYTDGKYIMNDPYTAGGKDKNFTDYYSLSSVFSVDSVSM